MIAIPVAALVVTAIVFLVADGRNRRASDAVARSVEAHAALEHVLGLVIDAEAGGRGYVLTGDPSYLVPLDHARGALPPALADLRDRLGTDPEQAARIEELTSTIEERLGVSGRLVEFGGRPDLASVEFGTVLDRGKRLTDLIRDQIAAILAVEDGRLAEHQDAAHEARTRGRWSVLSALAVGLIGGFAATLLYSRGVSRRLGALQRDAELLARGVPSPIETDADDEIGALGRSLRQARDELDARIAELRDREARLRAIVEFSPDAISVFDADGALLSTSPALRTLVGGTAAVAEGAAAGPEVHPDDVERFRAAVRRAATGEHERFSMRYRVRHADGGWVDLEARGQALVVGAEGPADVLVVSRDIQAQVSLEEAQRDAKEAAEAANLAKSEFLSRMSHELRTPLNAVLGFAQLLELEPLDGHQREAVDHVLKGGRHLLSLINEVLDLSRIDTGDISLSPEPVRLSELLGDALDLVRPLAADQDVRIESDPRSACDHFVLADRQRTQQVLLNLLSNAIKYNRRPGAISVFCTADDRRARIEVTDTGHGIRADLQHLLFAPFERLDAAQSGIEGTGIGLSLARRLTEAMGGTLELTSSSASGSTFTVLLPLVEAPADRHERLDRTEGNGQPRAEEPDQAASYRHTIVHIEDNLANIKLVERVFAARRGFRVIPALQGRLGLELAREHRPLAILLDLHLPDLDGDEVLSEILADPATSSIPVIIVSADATQRQIQRLVHRGAYAYLTKPVDVRQLMAHVDRIIDEGLTTAPEHRDQPWRRS